MFGNWESNSSLPISSIFEKAGARKQLTSEKEPNVSAAIQVLAGTW